MHLVVAVASDLHRTQEPNRNLFLTLSASPVELNGNGCQQVRSLLKQNGTSSTAATLAKLENVAAVIGSTGTYGAQAVPAGYISNRKEWVATAASVQAALRLPNEVLHDGVLLMDRAAAAGAIAADGPALPLAAAACLMLACQNQGEPGVPTQRCRVVAKSLPLH